MISFLTNFICYREFLQFKILSSCDFKLLSADQNKITGTINIGGSSAILIIPVKS